MHNAWSLVRGSIPCISKCVLIFFLLSRLPALFNHGRLTAPKPSSFSDSRMPGLKTPFFSRPGMVARAPAMLLVLSQVS